MILSRKAAILALAAGSAWVAGGQPARADPPRQASHARFVALLSADHQSPAPLAAEVRPPATARANPPRQADRARLVALRPPGPPWGRHPGPPWGWHPGPPWGRHPGPPWGRHPGPPWGRPPVTPHRH